ncbi:hypothetical protein NERG_02348 [Nematocida ausubeli]|uniref:Uncharacterized protein n=1 Tax=Nematocida ausubeli (strain ATCC PRA-371 / ERTm2) TaxID=1913371 RepID=H8ZFH7_NEMA1|nr:hypothetical protein NERG_02348 [Nematocida ausubeli]
MEYLLCGIPTDVENLVKYVQLTEDECRVEEVSEVSYSISRYQILISKHKAIGAEKDQKERHTISIIYPADKSKSRKALSRKKTTTDFTSNEIHLLMEELGCKNKGARAYTRSTYKYKEAEIVIVKKGEDVLVVVRTESPDSETILEDIKNRLRLWVNLIVPPEDTHDCLL